MPIACGVDTRPPGPPQVATSSASGTGGASGSSDTSTSVGPGPGPASVCECAAAAFTRDSICADCFHQVSGVDCADAVTACYDDPSCLALIAALAGCDAGAQCVADTLATHPGRNAYLDVLGCVCVSCRAECVAPSSVGCDAGKIPEEAGSDAATDGGADAEDAADGGEDAATADE
jgi:hypothetical protein